MSAIGQMYENDVQELLDGDEIILCPTALELVEELSVVIEDDLEKAQRLCNILIGSVTGTDLFTNCLQELPTNSGGNIGRNIVMNRVIKYFILQNKMKNVKVAWRTATPETISEVGAIFAAIEKGTTEWNNLLKVIMTGVELPKPTNSIKFSSRVSMSATSEFVTPIADRPLERHFDCDRVALLACALVPPLAL